MMNQIPRKTIFRWILESTLVLISAVGLMGVFTTGWGTREEASIPDVNGRIGFEEMGLSFFLMQPMASLRESIQSRIGCSSQRSGAVSFDMRPFTGVSVSHADLIPIEDMNGLVIRLGEIVVEAQCELDASLDAPISVAESNFKTACEPAFESGTKEFEDGCLESLIRYRAEIAAFYTRGEAPTEIKDPVVAAHVFLSKSLVERPDYPLLIGLSDTLAKHSARLVSWPLSLRMLYWWKNHYTKSARSLRKEFESRLVNTYQHTANLSAVFEVGLQDAALRADWVLVRAISQELRSRNQENAMSQFYLAWADFGKGKILDSLRSLGSLLEKYPNTEYAILARAARRGLQAGASQPFTFDPMGLSVGFVRTNSLSVQPFGSDEVVQETARYIERNFHRAPAEVEPYLVHAREKQLQVRLAEQAPITEPF